MSTELEDFDVKDAVIAPARPNLRERLEQSALDQITEALERNQCLVELGWQPKGGVYRTHESLNVVSETCLLTVRAILDDALSAHVHDNGLVTTMAEELRQEVAKALPEDLRVDAERPVWDQDRWVFTFRAQPKNDVIMEAMDEEDAVRPPDHRELYRELRDYGFNIEVEGQKITLWKRGVDHIAYVILNRDRYEGVVVKIGTMTRLLRNDEVIGFLRRSGFIAHQEGLEDAEDDDIKDIREPEGKVDKLRIMFENNGFHIVNVDEVPEDKGWGDLGVAQRQVVTAVQPTTDKPWTTSGHSPPEMTDFLIETRQRIADILGIDKATIDWSSRWREQPGWWEIVWFIADPDIKERRVVEGLDDEEDFKDIVGYPGSAEIADKVRVVLAELGVRDFTVGFSNLGYGMENTYVVARIPKGLGQLPFSTNQVKEDLQNVPGVEYVEAKVVGQKWVFSIYPKILCVRFGLGEALEDEDDHKDIVRPPTLEEISVKAYEILKEKGLTGSMHRAETFHAQFGPIYFLVVSVKRGLQQKLPVLELADAFSDLPGVAHVTHSAHGLKYEFSLYPLEARMRVFGEAMEEEDDLGQIPALAVIAHGIRNIFAELGIKRVRVGPKAGGGLRVEWRGWLGSPHRADRIKERIMQLPGVTGVAIGCCGDLTSFCVYSLLDEAMDEEDLPPIMNDDLIRVLKGAGWVDDSEGDNTVFSKNRVFRGNIVGYCKVCLHRDARPKSVEVTLAGIHPRGNWEEKDFYLGPDELIPFLTQHGFLSANKITEEKAGDDDRVAIVAVFREREGKHEVLTCLREEEGKRCIPGGHAHVGEDIKDAARREMDEETHLELGELTFVKKMPDETGKKDVYVYGTILLDGEKAQAGDDAEKLKWLPIDDLPELAFDNNALIAEIAEKLSLDEVKAVGETRNTPTQNYGISSLAEATTGDIIEAVLDPLGKGPLAGAERLDNAKATSGGRSCKGVQHIKEAFVAWHSSPYSFRKFDTSREGAHFGTREQADNLRKAGKKPAKPYLISIENPLRVRDMGVWTLDGIATELLRNDIISQPEYDAIREEFLWTDERGFAKLKAVLEAKGYDGFVYENEQEGPGDSYVAFYSRQIKPYRPVREGLDDETDDLKDVAGYVVVEEHIIEELDRAGLKDIKPANFGLYYRRYDGTWLPNQPVDDVVNHFTQAMGALGVDAHNVGLSYDAETGATSVMLRRAIYDQQPPQLQGWDDIQV